MSAEEIVHCQHCGEELRLVDGEWIDCETHGTCDRPEGLPNQTHEPVGDTGRATPAASTQQKAVNLAAVFRRYAKDVRRKSEGEAEDIAEAWDRAAEFVETEFGQATPAPPLDKAELVAARNGLRDVVVKLRGGHSAAMDESDHALAALDIAIGQVGATTTTPLSDPRRAAAVRAPSGEGRMSKGADDEQTPPIQGEGAATADRAHDGDSVCQRVGGEAVPASPDARHVPSALPLAVLEGRVGPFSAAGDPVWGVGVDGRTGELVNCAAVSGEGRADQTPTKRTVWAILERYTTPEQRTEWGVTPDRPIYLSLTRVLDHLGQVGRASQGWQPIETAPEAKQVWAWDAARGSNPAIRVDGTWYITYDDAEIHPTHWQPLPAPPGSGDGPPPELCADDAHLFGPCRTCGMPYLASRLQPPDEDDIAWAKRELEAGAGAVPPPR